MVANFILDVTKVAQRSGIKNLRQIGKNCFSGSTFAAKTAQELKEFHRAGLRKIIDFRAEASDEFAQLCRQTGFEYFNFPLYNTRNIAGRVKADGKVVTDEFVHNLKKFIDMTNDGQAYMGCLHGIDRTNLGVILNYLINPQAQIAPEIITWGGFGMKPVLNRTLKMARKLIKHMTPEQRSYLGLPENYNDLFRMKITKLLKLNMEKSRKI